MNFKKYKLTVKYWQDDAGLWRGEIDLNKNYIILLEDFLTKEELMDEFDNVCADFQDREADNKKLFEAFFDRKIISY